MSRVNRRASVEAFLPRTRQEMAARGWKALDVLIVTGDAYVDHPSFGGAVIGRVLESAGLRVGMLDCPELEPDGSGWQRLPAPRLFVGVTAGTIDSMVTLYTASKKRRRGDVYRTEGAPTRPKRATIAYTAAARHHFPSVPVVVGGLEAGPRRLSHYDYWDDKQRRSILVDSKADLLVWGMGERAVLDIVARLESGRGLQGIPGTCEVLREEELPANHRLVPSFEEIVAAPELQVDLFNAVREENAPDSAPLAQKHAARYVVQHAPPPPADQAEVDSFYDLPFTRESHPTHQAAGGVQALETVRWSVNTHRGCFADCSFCSITFHQGRSIQSRSPESIMREVESIVANPEFRGTITDVGGATANMYALGCSRLDEGKACLDRDCLTPEPCPALRLGSETEHYRELLGDVRAVEGVKHAFIGSGIRHDMLRDKSGELLPLHHDILENHISGRMKLAPEHASPDVLRAMNKPSFDVYEEYEADYKEECREMGRDQHLVNYFIVGHPGSGLHEAVHLFERLLVRDYAPEQVQEFIPLPMTRANVQYACGIDPQTLEELYVARTERERKLQKALVTWKAPKSRKLVEEALRQAERPDLLERYHKALRRVGKSSRGPGRSARPHDLDTCG